MAEYDYWTWICSRRNQVWENNILEQQEDIQLQDQLMALKWDFYSSCWDDETSTRGILCNYATLVEESTEQVVKRIMFDDEYEPLEEVEEEVQESLEVKEACETIDLSSSIELTCTSVINSCIPFQYLSSSYILYEQEPKKEFCIQTNILSRVLLRLCAEHFHIESSLRTTMIKAHM